MRFFDEAIDFSEVSGAVPAFIAEAQAEAALRFCRIAREAGRRLVSLWASSRGDTSEFTLHLTLDLAQGLCCLDVPILAESPVFPDFASIFPSANRLQRAVYDLIGIAPASGDTRPWLRHANWPIDFYPLRVAGVRPQPKDFSLENELYPFVRVEGDGVHEVAVGPIHAGIIEPGHFRFSVMGESVLRLEERLGWKHKGVDLCFKGMDVNAGARLSGRISGDSTVAYAWAYCQALEGIARVEIPLRAAYLRALMLERERVANHLGDLGYLGNDVALSFGLMQFLRLKEDWVRLNAVLFGHRWMMDRIIPGGVTVDIDGDGLQALLAQCRSVERAVRRLRHVYEEHAGLQDRFMGTGKISPDRARHLGLIGLAGRASGQGFDLRARHPCPPYTVLKPKQVVLSGGDVAARAEVRFAEIFESLRLIERIAIDLPAGELACAMPTVPRGRGFGWVEGWRGDVFVGLHTREDGTIDRCHCHDPSWHNWPALEHAIIDNIVPDFPLINKSFNLSYSGVDL